MCARVAVVFPSALSDGGQSVSVRRKGGGRCQQGAAKV